jgi:lysophospholipase L1-like esterase
MSPYAGFRVFGLALILILSASHRIAVSTSQPAKPASPIAGARRPFRILVLGDSVMWGQGLRNENKFTYKVRDWICAQRNNGSCPNPDDVDIYVEAHSGAVVAQPRKPSEKKEELRFVRIGSPVKYPGEVNHGYPTIWGQVDLAQRHYEQLSIPTQEVDLILVNGGINDLPATRILLPMLGGKIEALAQKYCEEEMKLLLNKLANTFPNARIIVPGYFPLVSVKTPESIVSETIGYLFLHKKEDSNKMGAIEAAAADPASAVSDKDAGPVLKWLATRSLNWTAASNTRLAAAVKSFNENHSNLPALSADGQAPPPDASMRALFVPIPFKEVNAYAASDSFLWKLVPKPPGEVFQCAEHDPLKKVMVNDELQKERPCMCDQAGKGNAVACVRAGTFHPNKQGAEAYFQSISKELGKIWRFTNWASLN